MSVEAEIYPGVYKLSIRGQELLATENLTPGITFYNEPTYLIDGVEYRSWNPTRSKLAAAILNGVRQLPIKPGTKLLYLGIAHGTTASHVSDIIGSGGHIWGVDFVARPLRDLLDKVSTHRGNISPILADARQPRSYGFLVPKVDVVFADVAQPDQAEIAVKNARMYLGRGGWVMLTIKSRSVDVSKSPGEVYESQVGVLIEAGFQVDEVVVLDPYEKDHAMALARY